MTSFAYVAMQNHKEVRGSIDAANEQDAVKLLRSQGMFIIDLTLGSNSDGINWRATLEKCKPSYWTPTNKRDYIQLYRQLSLMLMSGHTLLEALDLSADLASKAKLSATLRRIRTEIQHGKSFAEALALFPKTFPPQAIELVRSAEISGELDQVLHRLVIEQERAADLKRQLVTAMIYPVIVISLTIGLLVLMAVWVLPKMKVFIEGRALDLPASTQKMMAFSDLLTYHGLTVLIVFIAGIFSLLAFYTTTLGKKIFDRIILSLPLIGNAVLTENMARAGWSLALLTSSGVTIIDSLKICERISGNTSLKKSYHRAAEKVFNGSSLALAISQPFIPDLFRKMASVGEKSGELERVMEEMGNYYSQELQASIKRMLAFIEPTLLLMVGIPVAFVYLSIFQLIFAVSTGGN